MPQTITRLRDLAISWSLPTATTLAKAVTRLGFVQADPIRSPARAQDLILRHRVKDYRVGDLDRNYHRLNLEEDYLYAYGFMPKTTWGLLHPRTTRSLDPREQRTLEFAKGKPQIHPRDLEVEFGKASERNAWGGLSKSTTRTLERLHYLGLLRVVGRKDGVRLYKLNETLHQASDSNERLQKLVVLIAGILSPISQSSLQAALRHLGHAAPSLSGRKGVVARLVESGVLHHTQVDGIRYIWPAQFRQRTRAQDAVRFLAPFDPIVWDRRRFEHLWGWPYRFEAYTPAAKRTRGYYALPLLWKNNIIGWVNATQDRSRGLMLEPGFVHGSAPSEKSFRIAFNEEADNFRRFLEPRKLT